MSGSISTEGRHKLRTTTRIITANVTQTTTMTTMILIQLSMTVSSTIRLTTANTIAVTPTDKTITVFPPQVHPSKQRHHRLHLRRLSPLLPHFHLRLPHLPPALRLTRPTVRVQALGASRINPAHAQTSPGKQDILMRMMTRPHCWRGVKA